MKKLLFRFFMLCVFFTVLVALIIFYVSEKIEDKNNLENIRLISQGTFLSIDEFLKNSSPANWQTILAKSRPNEAGVVNVLPVNTLPLKITKINEVKNNELVYSLDELNPEMQVAVYKLTNNKQYAYQAIIEFNDSERAHRYFGWSVALISHKLQKTPQKEWPYLLTTLSNQYGYPISVIDKNSVPLNEQDKLRLSQNQWVVVLPNKTNDTIQILYVPLQMANKILVYGPYHTSLCWRIQKIYPIYIFIYCN